MKIQDNGWPPFLKHINCHDSAALQDIFTTCGAQIDTDQPQLALASNFTSTKSKMAAAAILKIYFNGHYSIVLRIFTQNLAQREKPTSQTQKYLQISLLGKFNMAADRHFENT